MGRPKRIQFAGACYFISLQGNNRQDIFLSNSDRRFFVSLLRGYKARYDLKVYAYCLMPASVNLLVETGQANLSLVMQGFNTVYTKYFNAEHHTSGHVFQGRYKALVVDKEHFLMDMTGYVHLAPARAGLPERPWRYQWSSCAAYVESDLREPLVESGPILKRFGKSRLIQSVKYTKYIKERLKMAGQWTPPVSRGFAIGDEAFAAKVEASPEAPDEGAQSHDAARKIIAEVAAKNGMDEAKLLGRSQWREITAVRREAIHRVWKEAKLGITEIGRLFNRTPSAISQLIRALENPSNSQY